MHAYLQAVYDVGPGGTSGPQGTTALHNAAFDGHGPCVCALLSSGASTEQRTFVGNWTALHFASSRGHEACIRLLLAAGADTEAKGTDAKTALCIAAGKGNESCVKALLEGGAHVNALNGVEGYSALHAAVDRGQGGVGV